MLNRTTATQTMIPSTPITTNTTRVATEPGLRLTRTSGLGTACALSILYTPEQECKGSAPGTASVQPESATSVDTLSQSNALGAVVGDLAEGLPATT